VEEVLARHVKLDNSLFNLGLNRVNLANVLAILWFNPFLGHKKAREESNTLVPNRIFKFVLPRLNKH
jgi:hypothetical protein